MNYSLLSLKYPYILRGTITQCNVVQKHRMDLSVINRQPAYMANYGKGKTNRINTFSQVIRVHLPAKIFISLNTQKDGVVYQSIVI